MIALRQLIKFTNAKPRQDFDVLTKLSVARVGGRNLFNKRSYKLTQNGNRYTLASKPSFPLLQSFYVVSGQVSLLSTLHFDSSCFLKYQQ
jgi:hypothetical protein